MHAGPGSCLITMSKQFKMTAQNFLHMQYMVVFQSVLMDVTTYMYTKRPEHGHGLSQHDNESGAAPGN